MPRVKRGFKARRRRNRILKEAKGFRGKRKNCYRIANETVQHARQHAYIGRKQKKRDFRRLWIARISAATTLRDISYSKFMGALKQKKVELNRKMLAEIAINDPKAFSQIVTLATS